MDQVVNRITNTVKDINTGKTSVRMSDIRPDGVISPTQLNTASTNSWDMFYIFKIFLIILILALLGLNVFTNLEKGTDFFTHLINEYGQFIPNVIKKTLNISEKGTKLGLDVAAGTIKDVKDIIEKDIGFHAKTWKARDKNLEKSIDAGNFRGMNNFPQYEPHETDDKIQEKNKKGWCYVGTDRTFRSCIKVNESEKCMSGKIFPTKEICINPALRE